MADKLHYVGDGIRGRHGGKLYCFRCPGCRTGHQFEHPPWSWNGSFDYPTIQPSLLVNPGSTHVCHSMVWDGKISFFADSYHELAGKTVELPDWEDTN